MASIKIKPEAAGKEIRITIASQFEVSELNKEYLLRGEVTVYEGRTNKLVVLVLDELVLNPKTTSIYSTTQVFARPRTTFNSLTFKHNATLFLKVLTEKDSIRVSLAPEVSSLKKKRK